MERILNIGKKLLNKRGFKKLKYILNFNQEAIKEFIINTVRKEVKSGSRILDVGAGSVKYKKYFQDCVYMTQDFKQYKDPQGKFQYGIIDYISDIIHIPVQENSFDVIICTEVLEHIPRPDLAIKEFSRILKLEGKLYITAPLVSGIHQSPYHYYGGFSKFWYFKYLSKYGFGEISVMPKKFFFAFYAQETLRALIYFAKSKKLRHKIFIPFVIPLILILPPVFFHLDKYNLDKYNPSYEITMGYLVKAKKLLGSAKYGQ